LVAPPSENPTSHGIRPVVVAFGSNLGDRRNAIVEAADQVSRLLSDFRLSSAIETLPVGAGLENDPPFLNAVGIGTSRASPRELLDALQSIEEQSGRTRPYPGAPRVLDLDLILVGDEIVNEAGLHVPHPRFRERRFVLEPLSEIASDLRDPVTGVTIGELFGRLKASD
jgi:2-amino-4-hydroxy-6-hydroxymethyldihydropteridine diphosphokinase